MGTFFRKTMRYFLCFCIVNVYLIKSLEIINQDISDDTIFCSENDDCILICDINNNGNCNGVTMICQNIDNGICKLQCIGNGACQRLSFESKNVKSVQIICGSQNGTYIQYIFLYFIKLISIYIIY